MDDKDATVLASLAEIAKSQARQIELLVRQLKVDRQDSDRPAAAPVRESITWAELWCHYSDAEHDKLESWDTVEGRAKHVLRILGAVAVAESTIHTLRHYREVRKTETTIRKGLTTATTRNREIELILRMSRWASRQKPPLVTVNPFAGYDRSDLFEGIENVRRNVIEDNQPGPLSLDELLGDADLFERAMVLTAHSSGMRRGELAVLERAWIDRRPDLTGEPLRIVEIPPGVSKGMRGQRKGRQTMLSMEALDAIDQYHASVPDLVRRRSPYVFMNPKNGDHYEVGYFTVRFRALVARRGLVGPSGPLWLHDCRRSFITLPRRRGEDTRNIMQMSGHRTASAFERYDIHSRIDAVMVRSRIDAARAAERAAMDAQRKGPLRAGPENISPVDKLRKHE